jgi:glycosyltransferase involved in cell wall biosynthesis
VRRGEPGPALELLARARAAGASPMRCDELQDRADAQHRLSNGSWAGQASRRSLEPVPGRVLHLVSHSLPHHRSGGTYRTQYIAAAQRAAGLEPELVTPLGFPDGEVPREELVDGIRYHRVGSDVTADVPPDERLRRNLEALVPVVERLRPAVLHPASDYHNALLALALRERFGIPVVYEVRGFPEERRVRREGSRAVHDQGVGRRALELECMFAADRIVTLAHVMRRHIADRGVPAEKVHIVPNAVDPEQLRPVPRDAELAASLGLSEGETVLGYVSTFHGYEGIHYIIHATAELIRRGHRVRALLVGDGHERAFLERTAHDEGISGAVIFTGRVPHEVVLDYYALIDLFIVPRRREATSELVTPLKPFEALATGRTVIASDVEALREIIADGSTGRTFTPDDPIALADVAEQLILEPERARALAAEGQRWVATERTWASNGARYRALYEELGAV